VLGDVPRVVGTFSSAPSEFWRLGPVLPCDIVELRVDQMPAGSDWLACGRSIEEKGTPVIVTIRSHTEGGAWSGPEDERMAHLNRALEQLSAVDIELKSRLAAKVAAAAKRQKKVCIVSFHDFKRTPRLSTLKSILSQAQKCGSVVKVSTMVKSRRDTDTLLALLLQKRKTPLCLIGMGPAATHTRISFATLGSCLTYGYLDKPAAPGQLSAARLSELLRELKVR